MPERFSGSPGELAAYKAGQIDQRLENHDEHLRAINGSLEKQANAQEELLKVVVGLAARFSLAGKIALVFLAAWASAIAYLILNHH